MIHFASHHMFNAVVLELAEPLGRVNHAHLIGVVDELEAHLDKDEPDDGPFLQRVPTHFAPEGVEVSMAAC